jgi:hypothetical protein
MAVNTSRIFISSSTINILFISYNYYALGYKSSWIVYTISLSSANFVGSVVSFLNVLVIRLRSLLLAASLSFESEVVLAFKRPY